MTGPASGNQRSGPSEQGSGVEFLTRPVLGDLGYWLLCTDTGSAAKVRLDAETGKRYLSHNGAFVWTTISLDSSELHVGVTLNEDGADWFHRTWHSIRPW